MRLHPAAVTAVAEFGGRYGQARLNPDQVRAIRAQLAAGQPQRRIAQAFGVTQPTISSIATGRRWRAVV
jgi:hypothetical protein